MHQTGIAQGATLAPEMQAMRHRGLGMLAVLLFISPFTFNFLDMKNKFYLESADIKAIAAAAEAMAEDTPGTTATGTPAASSGCTSSMSVP